MQSCVLVLGRRAKKKRIEDRFEKSPSQGKAQGTLLQDSREGGQKFSISLEQKSSRFLIN